MTRPGPLVVLAEDDEDDYTLTRGAFEAAGMTRPMLRVKNGEELLALLAAGTLGAVILLDLNMPRMDGRETLRRLKTDARLRRLPVVVLTTSCADEDVTLAYELGASSYLCKPLGFQEFVALAASFLAYWTGAVVPSPS